jgi:PPP family 3-phenylpropionic acid transporter
MPYWRLSAFYFFYFASLGALVPFWGLYLQDRGFTPLDIGQLMAILMATKIVAPNVWGWIADRSGVRMPIVRLASLLSVAVFLGVFADGGFWTLALVMSLFSFFWNASLPQVEAVTFNHLRERIRRYATIRLWGSIGFILTVAGLGQALEWQGTDLVPRVVLGLYLGIWLASLAVPEAAGAVPAEHQGSILVRLRSPEVLAFLFACFMMQASHGAYYAFYSIYLEGHGYSKTLIGGLWALGVLIEVLMFLVMHHLLQRFGARRVLIASLAVAVVRWLMIGGFPHELWILVLAQTLHAATFGTFHASAIHLVHHYFTGRLQGRGQALYSSLSYGGGGALGSLISGYLWSDAGPLTTFAVCSAGALLGTLAAWLWVDRARRY